MSSDLVENCGWETWGDEGTSKERIYSFTERKKNETEVSNKKKLRDYIVPKRGGCSSVLILAGIMGFQFLISFVNYDFVKDMHEREKLSRAQIESRFQKFPNSLDTETERIFARTIQTTFNTGYFGRLKYYYDVGLK